MISIIHVLKSSYSKNRVSKLSLKRSIAASCIILFALTGCTKKYIKPPERVEITEKTVIEETIVEEIIIDEKAMGNTDTEESLIEEAVASATITKPPPVEEATDKRGTVKTLKEPLLMEEASINKTGAGKTLLASPKKQGAKKIIKKTTTRKTTKTVKKIIEPIMQGKGLEAKTDGAISSSNSSQPERMSTQNLEPQNISHDSTTTLQLPLFIVGIIFVLMIMVIAMIISFPSPFQYRVFRTFLALGASLMASSIPGFINLDVPYFEKGTMEAGGAISIFLIVYLIDPVKPDIPVSQVAAQIFLGISNFFRKDYYTGKKVILRLYNLSPLGVSRLIVVHD